jgi:hypothetical protein
MKSFVSANKDFCEKLHGWFPVFFRDDDYVTKTLLKTKLDELCATHNPKTIMDVGSANRPMLECSPDYVLTGLDIEKLEGCDDFYDIFVVQSIETPVQTKQDLIYSNAVLEHVPDNNAAIHSIYGGLNAGGATAHYLPCKNHPYALILRVVGPRLQKVIIRKLRPWVISLGTTGYPTHFDYCSPGQMTRLFEKVGFSNVEIEVLYRANSYFQFFFPAFIAVTAFENLCRALNWKLFCSGMVISAQRN